MIHYYHMVFKTIYDNPIFEYPSVLCTGDEKNLPALEGQNAYSHKYLEHCYVF